MLVNRKELLGVLESIQPGLARQEVLEQSSCFVFRKGRALTYNDEISISHPVSFDLEGAVKADEFFRLLSKMKADEVDLSIDGKELLVKGKKTSAGICLEAEIQLPVDELKIPTEESSWKKIPERFCEGLRFCMFSASTDMTKPVLTCLHIKEDFVETCDNFRLTRYTLGSKIKGELLVPALAANQLVDYSPVAFSGSEGWIHFRNEKGVIFSCRTYQEKYPDLSTLLDVKGVKVQMPKSMPAMLERAGIFASSQFAQDEQVTITMKEGKVIVLGKGASGWCKERAKVDYTGAEVCFVVNPSFLKDTLSLDLQMVVSESKLKLSGGNFVHVVYLIAQGAGKKEKVDAQEEA